MEKDNVAFDFLITKIVYEILDLYFIDTSTGTDQAQKIDNF